MTDSHSAENLHLHAELLPNIRHITLYISQAPRLASQNLRPEITLSESRRAVSISFPEPFNHVSDTIKLPARVTESARRTLSSSTVPNSTNPIQKDETPQNEYSFRMQIDDTQDDPVLSRDEALDGFVPWTAGEMTASTRLRCRVCENVILDAPSANRDGDAQESNGRDDDTIRDNAQGWVWKDLPSGNWAEMMDFWHCHKPDPVEVQGNLSQEQSATVKGYGAANQVVATEGVVLVDVATFLVVEGDCRGVIVTEASEPPTQNQTQTQRELHCKQCSHLLGLEDPLTKGWRLFKTSLSASTLSEETTWTTHSIETVIAAQLLELIERESARRFVLHCGQKEGLLIWVFNPSLRYSNSSAEHSITAQRALKVLFQDVDDVDAMLHPEQGVPSSLSLEELRLPASVFEAVRDVLRERNDMLPASAREFREWRVSVLHRFERGSLSISGSR